MVDNLSPQDIPPQDIHGPPRVAKPYHVRVDPRDWYLRAQVGGRVDTLESTLGFFREIAAQVRATQSRRLMIIDESQGVVPSPDELEHLAILLKGEGLEKTRIAYVDVRGSAIDRIERGEIRARSHGYDFRVFGTEQQARLWLRYGHDEESGPV